MAQIPHGSSSTAEMIPETIWQLNLPDILFGQNAAHDLGYQLERLGVDSPAHGVVITDETVADAGHADRVRSIVEAEGFGLDVFTDVSREPSADEVDEYVATIADGPEYDFYLGLGGGSCMDAAKIVRAVVASDGDVLQYVRKPVGEGRPLQQPAAPLVVLPTTAGNPSEISFVASVRAGPDGEKKVIRDEAIRPDATVLDPTFTTTLPPDETAETLMDSLGPAIEAYTTFPQTARLHSTDPSVRQQPRGRTLLTDMLTERGIRLVAHNIRRVVNRGTDIEARSAVMLGTLFGSIASRAAGAHLGHATGYAVQEKYHTYHGVSIAVMTPASVLEYCAPSDPERFAHLAEILGAETAGIDTSDAARKAHDEYVQLQRDLGVLPSGLSELVGLEEDDDDALRDLTERTLRKERLLGRLPRPVDEESVAAVFRNAVDNW